MSEVDDVREKLLRKKKKSKSPIKPSALLSTGSTLLNLACSGRPLGGFLKGKYVLLVGDSDSGKTFLSLTCLAEASINQHFEDYRFIYDNAEDGAMMDIGRYFGQALADKMEPPAKDKEGEPVFSTTIEEFYYHVDDALDEGVPFIYILDSMDILSSEDEEKKFQQHKKASRKKRDEDGAEEKVAGSYTDGKPKKNSANLRRLRPKLRKSGSILIIINQTRDNIGSGPFTREKKTRSGGHAMKFYAILELWSSIKEKIYKTVKGKRRAIGILSHVQVKKNHLTGKSCAVDLPIYYSFGIDDVGSCIDYLIDENHWKKKKGNPTIRAPEFDFEGPREDLVRKIEDEGLEMNLRDLVGEVWKEIEEACAVRRKARY